MFLRFSRNTELWPETPAYQLLEKRGHVPAIDLKAELLDANLVEIEWKPPHVDERLFMPAQIQVELQKIEKCKEILDKTKLVLGRRLSGYVEFGDAWDVTVDGSSAMFTYSIMDAPAGGVVDLKIYCAVLEAWWRFLSDERCKCLLFDLDRLAIVD